VSRLGGLGWRWSPHRLGRTLPIYDRLRWSRAAVALVALLALVLAVRCAGRAAWAGVEAAPAPPAEAERVARQTAARVELPHWAPGPPLEAGERPEYAGPPPPPPWRGDEPGGALDGPARRLHDQGLAALVEGQPVSAANHLLAAAEAAPGSWLPRYHAGLALLAAGDRSAAFDELVEAERALRPRERSRAEVAAAEAATLSAEAAAATPDDCLAAVNSARRAIGALERYRRATSAAYRRAVAFPLEEAGIDGLHLWRRLADAYRGCDRPYADYRRRWPDAKPFRETEYAAVTEEVRTGPFPAQLEACIEASDPRVPCWALSNLNRVYARNRASYPAEGAEPAPEARRHAEGLAALAHDVAWLASREEADLGAAVEPLRLAARLPLPEGSEAASRVAALARHLAPDTGDYSFLAGPWSGRSADELSLAGDRAPEEVKGIAWELSDRWIARARGGDPAGLVAAAEGWRARAGPYGDSLSDWLERVREAWHGELAAEVRERRRNGDTARAVAVYELDSAWLGEGWPPLVAALGPGALVAWVGIALVWLAAIAAAWLVHRLVVVPYLMYTTDYYREEYTRRHADLRARGLPFTRSEVLAAERRRSG